MQAIARGRPAAKAAGITAAAIAPATSTLAAMWRERTAEILEGAHKGRKIFQNVTLTNANQQAVEIGTRLLKDICESVKTGPLKNLEVLLYKPVKVRLGIKRDKDGIYPDRNQVTQVRPYDYEPLKRGGGPALASPSSPQPAGSGSAAASPPSPSAPATPGGSAPWRQQ